MIAGKDDGERVVHLATLDERVRRKFLAANLWETVFR